ncbi:MAG: TetR/AcrR family transcriptional regulator [Frankiales bacterium]|jgi:AcrR family transcriptional regulator|nr:TetR/AcrR family transcriptional regulator [Frankiales bacterium]
MSAAQTPRRRSARDRLLETADRLFYDEGIHNVGIDRVLAQSGVAKGSLYYNFSGKDELVRTYLHNRHARWAARIDEELAAAAGPSAKILAVFDALAELFAEPGFRGCTFINAAAEAQPGSAEEQATKDFRTWLHELFGTFVTEAGYPDKLAAQLVMLYDGANISAQLDHNPGVAGAARDAAADLLDTAQAATRRPRPPSRRASD